MATALEVESATKAARVTLRPDDINSPNASGVIIGRYAWSSANYWNVNATNAFQYYTLSAGQPATKGIHMIFSWVNAGGIAIIKKVTANLVTGALTGTRNGLAAMYMYRAYGLGPALLVPAANLNQVPFPPSQGGSVTGVSSGPSSTTNTEGAGSTGMLANQPPSQARVDIYNSGSTFGAAAKGYIDTNPIGFIQGAAPNSAGGNIFVNEVLYDYVTAEQPLILVQGTGFQIMVDIPAAATSQTIGCFCNIQWDEWTPLSPGGR